MLPITRGALGVAAIVVAIVGVASLNLSGASPSPGAGAVPSPKPTSVAPMGSATPAPSPSPSPIDTATWTTYTSTRYGFSIGHPADWSFLPADHNWTFSKDAGDTRSPASSTAWDHYVAPTSDIAISAWSVAVTPGTTVESWLRAYCPKAENDSPCATIQDHAVPVTVDGHPGSLVSFLQDTQAFILVNNRMYVVASWRPWWMYNSLRLLQAFLSTMRLLPGGPVSAAPTPTPS
jgi:hypothetical protein